MYSASHNVSQTEALSVHLGSMKNVRLKAQREPRNRTSYSQCMITWILIFARLQCALISFMDGITVLLYRKAGSKV